MKTMRKESSRLREAVSNSGILTVDGDQIDMLLKAMSRIHVPWNSVSTTIRKVYQVLQAEGIISKEVATRTFQRIAVLDRVIEKTESALSRLSSHIDG
jgi:hypothetical protein